MVLYIVFFVFLIYFIEHDNFYAENGSTKIGPVIVSLEVGKKDGSLESLQVFILIFFDFNKIDSCIS